MDFIVAELVSGYLAHLPRLRADDFLSAIASYGREGRSKFLRSVSWVGRFVITQILDGGQRILIGLQLGGAQAFSFVLCHFSLSY
jgi:hypothetical protein